MTNDHDKTVPEGSGAAPAASPLSPQAASAASSTVNAKPGSRASSPGSATSSPVSALHASRIDSQAPLVFMHVPKTGGMSLFTAFAGLWGKSIADLYDVSPRNFQIAARAINDRSLPLYCGHYAFGMHEFFDRPVHYASVVREPVERLVSLYFYCQRMLGTYSERLRRVGGDMEALLRQPRVSDFYLDFMPWLPADRSPEAFFSAPSAELDNGMVRRFSGHGLSSVPCPPEALERAKANIERHFSVVGLLERYPETLAAMGRTFGLPALAQVHVNANRKEDREKTLEPAILERIRAMNPLDIALYDWIAERFDRLHADGFAPVRVRGGGRTDFEHLPLWRSVGQSPIREATMEAKGLPPKQTRKPTLLRCASVTGAGIEPKGVFVDLKLAQRAAGGGEPVQVDGRLALTPESARRLLKGLGRALEAHREKFGGGTTAPG